MQDMREMQGREQLPEKYNDETDELLHKYANGCLMKTPTMEGAGYKTQAQRAKA